MKPLSSLPVSGLRVFLRADLDVSFAEAPNSIRLKALKPTVDFLLSHGAAKVIIAGHLGRPTGPNPALSLRNIAPFIETMLQRSVIFSDVLEIKSLESLFLLENLRFWPGEEACDVEFSTKLASLADCYVNDAFGVVHRAHASVVGVPRLLPHAAGLHLQEEVSQLTKLIESPKRPFVAIIGGAKLETKLPVIENLAKIADYVLVGGLIAKEYTQVATPHESNVMTATSNPDGLDIDEKSTQKFAQIIKSAKTVVWNGPVGKFEDGHDFGSKAIAASIVESSAYCVVGGGETVDFLGKSGFLSKVSFASCGGGAMLEFLAGKELPGIAALV